MGHKAHPIGLRLGTHRKWKSNWYFESKNYTKFLQLNLYIENFIKGFLFFYKMKKTLVLQTQIVKLPNNIMYVFIFYYRFRKKWKYSIFNRKKRFLWSLYLDNYFLKKKIKSKYNLNNYKFYKNFNHYNLDSSLNILLKKINLNQKSKLFYEILKINFKNIFLKFINFKKYYFKNLNLIQKYFLKKFILNVLKQIKILKIFNNIFNFNLKNEMKNNYILKTFLLFKLYLDNYIKFIYFLKYNLNPYKILRLSFYIFKNIKKIKMLKKHLKSLKTFSFIWKKKLLKKKIKFIYLLKKKNEILEEYKYKFIFNKKTKKIVFLTFSKQNNLEKYFSKKTKLKILHPFTKIKIFLSKISNIKINLIFINGLSFTQFFYAVQEDTPVKAYEGRFDLWVIQRAMLNRYKYNAIFIKDFIHLSAILILLKNPVPLVKFIGYQFKRLPKNRKQFKLLKFINQSLNIFCKQCSEVVGFKFQITGRLNRRRRTHKWVFKKGILSLQTQKTRVEYGYSEGFTRRGLIGIHFWIFYDKNFSKILKKKIIQYLYYSKYKNILNKNNNPLQKFINYKPIRNNAKT